LSKPPAGAGIAVDREQRPGHQPKEQLSDHLQTLEGDGADGGCRSSSSATISRRGQNGAA